MLEAIMDGISEGVTEIVQTIEHSRLRNRAYRYQDEGRFEKAKDAYTQLALEEQDSVRQAMYLGCAAHAANRAEEYYQARLLANAGLTILKKSGEECRSVAMHLLYCRGVAELNLPTTPVILLTKRKKKERASCTGAC
ncbi:hypothetical protein JW898_03005 [Candidatus Woesearchaeota archaeon]|nr:hypothetical protein [Candidatus Woesearchaeota archaeon]